MLPEIFYHPWYMNIGQDVDQTKQFMMQPVVDGLIERINRIKRIYDGKKKAHLW